MSTRDDRLYFAGFVDGEGCIAAYLNPRRTRWYIRVSVAQNTRAVLDQMRLVWGGRVYDGRQSSRAFYWNVNGIQAATFLRDVGPHLRIKYEQAQMALWLDRNRMNDDRSRRMVERLKHAKKS